MLIFPAHGMLGGLDEVIFLAVVVIFIGMMAISWMRSQSASDATETDEVVPTSAPSTDENRFELK